MTTLPNPFAGLLQMLAKAFAPLADRDGLDSQRAFVVRGSRSKTRRSSRALTTRARDTSTHRTPEPKSTEPPVTMHHGQFADPRWASIRACESDVHTHPTPKE